ncbi:MAG TPA: hypothetical protein VH020_01975 [Stellaceae bacterium]|nr:hypothetical protein [Stellaceae bacterium]
MLFFLATIDEDSSQKNFVIPAKTGIQGTRRESALGTCFRRDDETACGVRQNNLPHIAPRDLRCDDLCYAFCAIMCVTVGKIEQWAGSRVLPFSDKF